MTQTEILKIAILKEKYQVQSDTLLKVITHPKSANDEIEKSAVARRFVRGFIDDLNAL